MKYHFLGKVVFEDGAYLIKIPFNVWEVCTGQGSFPAEVIAEGKEFSCELVPLGKGLYNIPLTEELANALGVTNQAVSKWESAQCCPDIQLLPDLAKIFDVSIDELIGYKSTEGLGDICLKIKEHFSALPEKKAFENAYRIAALLHEIASTDGYKKTVPWKEKDYAADHVSSWGLSICSEPEGCTGRKNNNIFFSVSAYPRPLM